MHRRTVAAAVALLLGASAGLVLPGGARANGTEALGSPAGITVASGTGTAAGGVGLVHSQPRPLQVSVPPGAAVRQVLLYWEGQFTAPQTSGDSTITVNGATVTGALIGGPTTFFFDGGKAVRSAAYRADITGRNAVGPGLNTLQVGGLTNNYRNDGAGVLVIFDTGFAHPIQVRDGLDLAYVNFKAPLDTTAPQTFTFPAASVPRTADLTIMAASVAPNRPHVLRLTVGNQTVDVVNPFGDLQGAEWDTKQFPVTIPPGVTSLTARLLSEGDGSGRRPASIIWVNASLSLPPCPVGPNPTTAATSGSAFGVLVQLAGTTIVDHLGQVDSSAPPSPSADTFALLPVDVPGVLDATILSTTSNSSIGPAATSTATATVADLDLLGGAVTASKVRAVSQSTASTAGATPSSLGTHFENLVVNGTPVTNVAPNTSLVVNQPGTTTPVAILHLYEQVSSSSLSPGTATASNGVNMLRLEALPGAPVSAHVVIAHADTDATSSAHPCGLTSRVSGEAFTTFVQGRLGSPPVPVVTKKFAAAVLPATGGADDAHLKRTAVPALAGSIAGDNTTSGALTPNPNATARSITKNLSLLGGAITATALDVKSTSIATGASASTVFDVKFVNLVVGGTPIAQNPPPNTTIAIPSPGGGIVLVILNEQVVNTPDGSNTEGTVNAIHAYALTATGAVDGEIIVASAHSDAHK